MKKIAIIYGKLENGIQKKSVEILSKILLDYTYEYPCCFEFGTDIPSNHRKIYIGTKENNGYIRKNSNALLSHSDEYFISVRDEVVIIEGFDDSGVLYGCIDFYNKYIIKQEFPHTDKYRINCFEKDLPDFEYSSRPSVSDRGIWTWGHVIYDYRGFIDNMVMLKMNTIIVWNDYVPINAREMVEYAHSCGIKVIWGFAWGWDTNCRKIELDKLCERSADIFKKYEDEYSRLGGDGIYFQTATEVHTEENNGIIIAEAVTNFVNKTAALFYEKYPNLEIQFGLHATSVKTKLKYISEVDKRIRIVWENCGSFPFSYIPNDIKDFDETVDFVNEIAVLRGNGEKFGAVTKGLTKLDWSKFEHMDGSGFVGASSKLMKADRVVRKSKIWRYLQAFWLTNADKALEMIKVMGEARNGDLCITALIEDGMFEEHIMYPAAIFSEMLWNADADIKELMSEVALRSYVDFA